MPMTINLSRTRPTIIFAAAALMLAALPVHAEVMDKELSRIGLLAVTVIGGVIGFVLCRVKPLLILLVAPLTAAVPFFQVMETYDRVVGPAIRREAGISYVIEAHFAVALVLIANVVGFAMGQHRRRSRDGSASNGRPLMHGPPA